jgi:hypothetical protein
MTTIVLLPEPICRDDTEHGKDYYTEADLLAYGDERAKAAVEAERASLVEEVEALRYEVQVLRQYINTPAYANDPKPGLEPRRTAEHPAPAAGERYTIRVKFDGDGNHLITCDQVDGLLIASESLTRSLADFEESVALLESLRAPQGDSNG